MVVNKYEEVLIIPGTVWAFHWPCNICTHSLQGPGCLCEWEPGDCLMLHALETVNAVYIAFTNPRIRIADFYACDHRYQGSDRFAVKVSESFVPGL